MSPEQFAEKMRKIADGDDREARHIEADNLMCKVLDNLGFGKGVEIFQDMSRWYA